MTDTNKDENENDELTCPITLELFRDPVRAKDGHVYERQAITKWILEHGTSPLTRQILDVRDLQPDEHLRNLARQRRTSSVSYNAQNERVILPSIRPINRFRSRIYPAGIHPSSNKRCQYIVLSICCFIIPTGLILATLFTLKTPQNNFQSTYNGTLTANSSLFNRLNPSNIGQFYYDQISMSVFAGGLYTFQCNSSFNSYAYLYHDYFDSTNVYFNLLMSDDKSGNGYQFYFQYSIQSFKEYILIVTSFQNNTIGSFSLYVSGPSNVYFH